MDCRLPGSSVHEILQQEYWSGLPCAPPGDLPEPGIKTMSLAFKAVSCIAGRFFTTEPSGKPQEQLEPKPHHGKLTKMRKQRVLSQMKGQDKTLEKQPNEVEIGNLPEKEFIIMIVKMMQDLGEIMEKRQEMFSKYLELKNKQ